MVVKSTSEEKMLIETADAHCHLDAVAPDLIMSAVHNGVKTMVTNGIDVASSIRALQISDRVNIFASIGIDPVHAVIATKEQLEAITEMIRNNKNSIVGIGEVGLDKGGGITKYESQKRVFSMFLDLANELNLPVSIHSRNAIEDVLSMLESKKVKKAHIHFFEGGIAHVRLIQRLGYMVSIPPVDSEKRRKVIKELPIDNIMLESDSPAASESPIGVREAMRIIAEAKGLSMGRVAEATTANTKRFFGVVRNSGMMRV